MIDLGNSQSLMILSREYSHLASLSDNGGYRWHGSPVLRSKMSVTSEWSTMTLEQHTEWKSDIKDNSYYQTKWRGSSEHNCQAFIHNSLEPYLGVLTVRVFHCLVNPVTLLDYSSDENIFIVGIQGNIDDLLMCRLALP